MEADWKNDGAEILRLVKHRQNDKKTIIESSEIDIRKYKGDIVVSHDNFNLEQAIRLKDINFLDEEILIILNLKEEGLEEDCIKLMSKYKRINWFFLDMSMPYFVKFSLLSNQEKIADFSKKNLCVRYSEHEAIEYAIGFSGRVEWVWVDCFSILPLDLEIYKILKNNFKICLVSPELQGHPLGMIEEFKKKIKALNFKIDAICTKRIDLWTL